MTNLILLFKKIRDKGLLWFFNRIGMEIRNPSKPISKATIDFFLSIKLRIVRIFKKVIKDDLLYLIYDLEVCDITRFVFVLVDAELESKKLGKKRFCCCHCSIFSFRRTYLNFAEYDLPLTMIVSCGVFII